MTKYTVKRNPDPRSPGWSIDVTGPDSAKSYMANSTTFETKAEAEAYCDRLNKLFGDKNEA